ncbi:hypothetical protein MTR_1g098737 [Medicago truncatula]|uniref:Uncharacterized protein n=1 Tax=Medicago truncatula TaxID=3880 RepID=A0A072VPB7_MEDTR|nr:hypothetical protein MTR_1g098737 [Medicago truncatula]
MSKDFHTLGLIRKPRTGHSNIKPSDLIAKWKSFAAAFDTSASFTTFLHQLID